MKKKEVEKVNIRETLFQQRIIRSIDKPQTFRKINDKNYKNDIDKKYNKPRELLFEDKIEIKYDPKGIFAKKQSQFMQYTIISQMDIKSIANMLFSNSFFSKETTKCLIELFQSIKMQLNREQSIQQIIELQVAHEQIPPLINQTILIISKHIFQGTDNNQRLLKNDPENVYNIQVEAVRAKNKKDQYDFQKEAILENVKQKEIIMIDQSWWRDFKFDDQWLTVVDIYNLTLNLLNQDLTLDCLCLLKLDFQQGGLRYILNIEKQLENKKLLQHQNTKQKISAMNNSLLKIDRLEVIAEIMQEQMKSSKETNMSMAFFEQIFEILFKSNKLFKITDKESFKFSSQFFYFTENNLKIILALLQCLEILIQESEVVEDAFHSRMKNPIQNLTRFFFKWMFHDVSRIRLQEIKVRAIVSSYNIEDKRMVIGRSSILKKKVKEKFSEDLKLNQLIIMQGIFHDDKFNSIQNQLKLVETKLYNSRLYDQQLQEFENQVKDRDSLLIKISYEQY